MIINKTFRRLIVLGCLFSLFLVGKAQFAFGKESFKFNRLMQLIENYYVDTANTHELVESAVKSVLKDLDPHSTYIPEKQVKKVNEPLKGEFEGIGIMFNILEDTVYVISPISGGPSERVGIQSGDRIIEVEGETIAGIGITSKGVRKRLLGEKGSKVTVGVKRKGVEKTLHFTITRDKIPIHSLEAAYMINDSIGYIKINRFSRKTMNEFKTAVDSFQKSHQLNHLVLDLTGNGGGYLKTAIQLADNFLGHSRLILYTEGKNVPKRTFKAKREGDFENGRVAVMIDEGSASASEIVSGALQDWDRGMVVGRRSFGKGSVQRQFRLPDSSMVRLTVAKYHTPTGRVIQKPYKGGGEKYRKEILNRYKHGELSNKDSIQFPDSLKYKTLKNGRTVYGGGGIMPDFFVPVDTTEATDYLQQLIGKGILYKFTLNYVDEHRNEMNTAYPSFNQYKERFTVDTGLLNQLFTFAEKKNLERNKSQIKQSQDRIAFLTKAYIARSRWDNEKFYQIMNQKNDIFLKAKEVLENPEMYRRKLQQTGKE